MCVCLSVCETPKEWFTHCAVSPNVRYLPGLYKVTVMFYSGCRALQGTEHGVPFVQLPVPQVMVQLCYVTGIVGHRQSI